MSRPQLTAVNHYDVFPFNHGGSLGIRGLYKALSEWFDINIITFVTSDYLKTEVNISKHVKVIPIVLPDDIKKKQERLYSEYNMSSETLVDSSPAAIRWYHTSPEIIDQVRNISKDSIIVLAEHVYTWNIIKEACPDKHLWYRANNVEYDYKLTTWDKIGCPKDLLQEVYDIEKECIDECEKILTVSQLETERFMDLYQVDESKRDKFLNIRSGYDVDDLKTVLPKDRIPLEGGYKYTGVFIASNTPNTVVAANVCIDIARQCPEIQIILVGSISKAFLDAKLPENILFTGIVSDSDKFYYLQHCDFALNLLEAGAGINVKMFEYFAFGIPVITTVYGARGIELISGRDCIITEKNRYVQDINKFLFLSTEQKNEIAENALKTLIDKYSWRSLGKNIVREIEQMYDFDASKYVLSLEEIKLYVFEEENSYLPKKPCYIRCAGDWGTRCLHYLRKNGIEPIAFVDGDKNKIGNKIAGVPVISVEEYVQQREGTEIITSIVVGLADVIRDLLHRGVPIEEISLAWAGIKIINIKDSQGALPYYVSLDKWKKKLGYDMQ